MSTAAFGLLLCALLPGAFVSWAADWAMGMGGYELPSYAREAGSFLDASALFVGVAVVVGGVVVLVLLAFEDQLGNERRLVRGASGVVLVVGFVAVVAGYVGAHRAAIDAAEGARTASAEASVLAVERVQPDWDRESELRVVFPVQDSEVRRLTLRHPDQHLAVDVEDTVAVTYDPDDPGNVALAYPSARGRGATGAVVFYVAVAVISLSVVAWLGVIWWAIARARRSRRVEQAGRRG